MAGESMISQGSIEKRAEELEKKQAEEAAAAGKGAEVPPEGDKGEEKGEENVPQKKDNEELSPKGVKTPAKDEKTGKFVKAEEKPMPEDSKELRKWATRLSMENAETRKLLETVMGMLTKQQREKIDWKELAKDPAKLQKIVEDREKELIESHRKEYTENMNQATAEITNLESTRRFNDPQNYPRWAELMPVMKQLSKPTETQPNGDPRINFNQHPRLVLDALYELAQEVADNDPNYKKPEPKKAPGKSYSQEEFDAAVAKAREEAAAEHEKGLAAEKKGAGVGSMGKGTPKGKPGEVNKEVLWNMPLDSLKAGLIRATDELHGR